MAIADGNILRVSCRMLTNLSNDIVNVFHVFVDDNGTGNDDDFLNELCAYFNNAYSEIAAKLSNNTVTNTIDVYNVTQDAPLGQHSWGAGFSGGTAGGDQMPLQDCLLILWPTNTKRMQGKTYLGPFTVGSLADGVWDADTLLAAAGFATALQTTWGGALGESMHMGIYSRTSGLFRTPVTRRISSVPATQRRRKPGRGS